MVLNQSKQPIFIFSLRHLNSYEDAKITPQLIKKSFSQIMDIHFPPVLKEDIKFVRLWIQAKGKWYDIPNVSASSFINWANETKQMKEPEPKFKDFNKILKIISADYNLSHVCVKKKAPPFLHLNTKSR